jgi:hypothetical protein
MKAAEAGGKAFEFSSNPSRKEQTPMAFFYEIRSSNNALLKRDGGFATLDAARMAARDDAKKIKNASRTAGGGAVAGEASSQGRSGGKLPSPERRR